MTTSRSISLRLFLTAILFGLAGVAAGQAATRPSRRPHVSKTAPPRRSRTRSRPGSGNRPNDPFAASRRDPFAPLISDHSKPGTKIIRPPGKAGLTIDEIRIQGTVRGPRGAVAVVSDPKGHVYFLRPGDRLFDGTVERIGMHGVAFIEHGRDAFGRTYERRVTKPVQSPKGAKP